MFKNLGAIASIPDNRLKVALCLLDLTTEFGKEFAQLLPNYFTEKEVSGPVPLSALIRKATENFDREAPGERKGSTFLGLHEYYALEDLDVPHQTFGWHTEDFERFIDLLPIPDESWKQLDFGDIVIWQDTQWLVVDDNWGGEWITLAPLASICIDVSLDDLREEYFRKKYRHRGTDHNTLETSIFHATEE